ncbi:MAG: hypothetical protein Q9191_003408 [Dirinaria sp. TL-2023a]
MSYNGENDAAQQPQPQPSNDHQQPPSSEAQPRAQSSASESVPTPSTFQTAEAQMATGVQPAHSTASIASAVAANPLSPPPTGAAPWPQYHVDPPGTFSGFRARAPRNRGRGRGRGSHNWGANDRHGQDWRGTPSVQSPPSTPAPFLHQYGQQPYSSFLPALQYAQYGQPSPYAAAPPPPPASIAPQAQPTPAQGQLPRTSEHHRQFQGSQRRDKSKGVEKKTKGFAGNPAGTKKLKRNLRAGAHNAKKEAELKRLKEGEETKKQQEEAAAAKKVKEENITPPRQPYAAPTDDLQKRLDAVEKESNAPKKQWQESAANKERDEHEGESKEEEKEGRAE